MKKYIAFAAVAGALGFLAFHIYKMEVEKNRAGKNLKVKKVSDVKPQTIQIIPAVSEAVRNNNRNNVRTTR